MSNQRELFPIRGGRRPGAGRPRAPGRPRNWVRSRPAHSKHTPVHVTLRVAAAVGALRRRRAYHAIRGALLVVAGRASFRIAHLSIQRTHIHLICEADDREALSRGLQAFQISAAKRLNTAMSAELRLVRRRRGAVFVERYHAEVLTSPRQVRNAIAYVLNNWRRHGEVRRPAPLDPYASGLFFDGWSAPRSWSAPPGYDPLPVIDPHTWLLTVGWRRHALIDPFEIPGT